MVTSLQGHSWEGCMQNNKHDKNHTFHSFYQAPSWSSFSLWLCSALWASSLSAVSVHTHTHTVHTLTALSGFMTSALCTHPLSSPHPLWWCWGVALAAPAHLSFLPRLVPWSHECASTLGSLHGRLVAWPLHRHWDRDRNKFATQRPQVWQWRHCAYSSWLNCTCKCFKMVSNNNIPFSLSFPPDSKQ